MKAKNIQEFRLAIAELARSQGWRVYSKSSQGEGNSVNAGFPGLMMYKENRIIAMHPKMGMFDCTQAESEWLEAMRHHFPAYEIVYPHDIKKVKWILVDDWDEYVSLTETFKDIDSEWGEDKYKEETK